MRANLRPGERLIMETREHWLQMAVPVLVSLALLAAFISLWVMVKEPWIAWVSLVGIATSIGYFIVKYIERKYNLWAVTNMRLIDEEGFFTHSSKESPLDKINNVSYKQTVLGRMLKYGNVIIQTAAEDGETNYNFIQKPQELTEAIVAAQQAYRLGPVSSEDLKKGLDQASGDTKECPFCAEIVKAKAKVCRYCGKEIPE